MSETRNEKAPVVQSFNEWDPLEEVIVGTVLGAMYPECGPILAAAGEPEWLWHYQGVHVEEESVQAAHEQLEELVRVLKAEGVKVRRPDPIPHNIGYSTPYWHCRSGWNTANPRDLFLVVGDEIIECASPMRHRHFESLAYRRLFTEYFRAGARLTSAPRARPARRALRPQLPPTGPTARPTWASGSCPRATTHRYPITEDEPVWEAADFVRCGRDLFVIRSVVTNELGIEWVRRHLGSGVPRARDQDAVLDAAATSTRRSCRSRRARCWSTRTGSTWPSCPSACANGTCSRPRGRPTTRIRRWPTRSSAASGSR